MLRVDIGFRAVHEFIMAVFYVGADGIQNISRN